MNNNVLFYNSILRSAAVGTISTSGLTTSQVLKPGSFSTWTHIVSFERLLSGTPILFFYDQDTRAGAIGTIQNGAFNTTKSFPKGAFSTWTHVVCTSGTMNESLLFFYNSADGSAAIGVLSEADFVTTAAVTAGSLSSWAHIASVGTTLFFYDRNSGAGAIGVVSKQGLHTSRAFPKGAFSRWSHIASAGSLLLFFDRQTRAGAIGRLTQDDLVTVKSLGAGSLSPWSHIVSGEEFVNVVFPLVDPAVPFGPGIVDDKIPTIEAKQPANTFKGPGGLLLFYDIERGAGAVVALQEQGLTTIHNLKNGSFSSWTQISNDSARIDPDVELWRARQLIQQKYDALGGYRSPLGMPINGQLVPLQQPEVVRSAAAYTANFRGGKITLKSAPGASPEALGEHVVTVILKGLECRVRQESEDEVYGSVGTIVGATRQSSIVHFPDGQESFTLGQAGNRVVEMNQVVYEGPPALLSFPCLLVEHDSGDTSEYKKKVAEALAKAAQAGLTAIGVPAEAAAADQGFISDLSLGLVNVISSAIGADDDRYNTGVLQLEAHDVLRHNFKTQHFKRDDDPREFSFTHFVAVSGTDDGGSTGQYAFYFDVHLDLKIRIF